MELPNLMIDPSLVAATAAGLGTASAVLWWLIRKRQKRLWLPTIRVVELENRVMPRLVLRPPPWISFLCFVLSALILTFFAFKPRTQVFTPFEPNQTHIHLFVDLSPSVAAQLPLPEYANRLAELMKTLQASGRVTISTSHSREVLEADSPEKLHAKILALGYHRAGLKLGTALKAMIQGLGEVDRLFIAGDRDQHTWTGFNWRYLQDEMDVVFVDVTSLPMDAPNFYISDAQFLSNVASQTMDWEVEVARRHRSGEAHGTLIVRYRETELARTSWKIADAKTRTLARVSWSANLVMADKGALALDAAASPPLLFQIEVSDGDTLSLDNELRMPPLGIRQNGLLIAETNGERPLEDPAQQLSVSLDILGFQTKRLDFVQGDGPPPEEYPFWAILGGSGSGIDRFCPRSLQKARAQAATAAHSKRLFPKVWLAPYTLDADYGELCQCYARLLKSGDAASYCQHVTSRSQWVGLLPSLGAKQIGGQIGDTTGSLAFLGKDAASGLEVLAFTVPLEPSMQTGITHATMPVMVRDLLQWQGLLEARGKAQTSAWPRLEDIVTVVWREGLDANERQRSVQSNVPLAESLFAEMQAQTLPPRWTAQMDAASRAMPVKKDREDPLPWLKLAVFLVLLALVVEALWLLGTRLLQWLSRRPEAVLLLVIALGAVLTPRAQAKVALSLLGYPDAAMSFANLAREVSQRTSIELAMRPDQFAKLTPMALGQPWLWVTNLALVTGEGGSLNPDVLIWLRRGGFLVIESPAPEAALSALAGRLIPEAVAKGAAFLPLPPDHELMRSFYLLDALPQCNGQIWRGLAYDGRLAILVIPYGLLDSIKDKATPSPCPNAPDSERSVRIFVNLVMVALATDYKKDQIHLPEILKRLR